MSKVRTPRYRQIFKGKPDREATAKRVFREVVDDLEGRGVCTKTRVAIADRYARVRAEYEDLYPDAANEGPVLKGGEDGSGGEYFNYRWSAVEKLAERMAKIERQLGLDLGGRLEAKAPPNGDRKTAADDYLDD